MLSGLLLLACLLVPLSAGPRYSSRIVETKSGHIRGIILELNSGRLEPVEAFLGVPYGEARERFAQSGPGRGWSGLKFAESYPPVCPQSLPELQNRTAALQHMPRARYLFLKKLQPFLANQSEDCLYLNIYVPGSGARGLEAPYAVMVYLHGESFEWNSGNHYDGSVLASYGHVIFITVNYRLGVFGFLKTGPEWPAAAGDVAQALTWIKENIGSFGGDPTRITLLGHHTGAALASLLLVSPQAKGLFRRACLVSGSVLSPWGHGQDPGGLVLRLAAEAGCTEEPLSCLRTMPFRSLASLPLTAPRFLTPVGPWTRGDPGSAVEAAGEPFVTSQLLIGTTTTESYLDFSSHEIQYGIEEDQRNRVLRTYVRNAYDYHLNEIFSTVRNEYTDWEKPIQHPINIRDSTMEALSDGHTVAPLLRLGYLHARRGAPTYFYHFNHQSKESDYPQRLGSVRGEDVNYLLGLPLVEGKPFFPQNYTAQDQKVAETVITFFTNFAKTGDPNEPRKVDGAHVKEKGRHKGFIWDQYEPTTQLYLSLGLKPRMKSHYRGHKMAIWLNLIPQLHQPGDQDVSMRHHHFHERASHFYAGGVRAESFTRAPPTTLVPELGEPVECPPNSTRDEPLGLSGSGTQVKVPPSPGPGEPSGSLDQLSFHSSPLALGLVLGLACLFLVLNALIFSAIYYQRRRKNNQEKKRSMPVDEPDDLCLGLELKERKPPPPTPPLRTSSVPVTPPAAVKKRVQIQEISV